MAKSRELPDKIWFEVEFLPACENGCMGWKVVNIDGTNLHDCDEIYSTSHGALGITEIRLGSNMHQLTKVGLGDSILYEGEFIPNSRIDNLLQLLKQSHRAATALLEGCKKELESNRYYSDRIRKRWTPDMEPSIDVAEDVQDEEE